MPPTTIVLQISCPSAVTATSLDGAPIPVAYGNPTVIGGASPVTTSCQPTAAGPFAVGNTSVACTARDANQRTAACSFNVTVAKQPLLNATRFVAFGDSITEGKSGDCIRVPTIRSRHGRLVEDLRFLRNVGANETYPAVLHGLLATRYSTQMPAVFNQGFGGERASESETRRRLDDVITTHAAQVVLLQEGVNDLHGAMSTAQGVIDVVEGITDLIRVAKGRGAQVLLGTLLPERAEPRPGETPPCNRAQTPQAIGPANTQLRALAAAEGAVLVDLEPVFFGQLNTLLGEDGLHPTAAGYQRIAETFFEAIRSRLEVP